MPTDIKNDLHDLVDDHPDWPAAEFVKIINEKYANRPDKPSRRTIERHVRDMRDPSGLWDLTEGDPVDSRMVLDLLGELIRTRGLKRAPRLTKGRVEWLLKLSRLAPDMDATRLSALSAIYQSATSAKPAEGEESAARDLADIEAYLALRAWDPSNVAEYVVGVANERFRPIRTWQAFVEDGGLYLHYIKDSTGDGAAVEFPEWLRAQGYGDLDRTRQRFAAMLAGRDSLKAMNRELQASSGAEED